VSVEMMDARTVVLYVAMLVAVKKDSTIVEL
jgi:hypothetical protein